MDTLDELHNRLRVAGALLNTAAGEIRDLPLSPTKKNIRHIGEALASIFEIMRAIYAVRPDLTPVALDEPGPASEANRRLTHALGEAIRLVEQGQTSAALEHLASYAASEASPLHKDIALNELNRLTGKAGT